ncbi:MAG: phage major capsid protein [bacterium]|nr:phage major capsid protein [bacterium]
MASVTLAESAKLAQDELVAGVIEDIITVNQFFQVMPFDDIEGNSLKYNRENVLGGVGAAEVGDVIGTDDDNPLTGGSGEGKDAATFTEVFSGLTTILGDAEVNGMIQATRSGQGNDQTAVQVASKAKHAGRLYQYMLVNGSGAAPEFSGLLTLCAAAQKVLATATDGDVLSFDKMDEVMDLVTAKDGQVDYLCMHARERRAYRGLLRGLGGAAIMEVVELPSGEEIMAYSGVPVFRNDYLPIDQTQGASTNASTFLAGCFDDGSRSNGLAGLTARQEAGIKVTDVGEAETKDEHIWRVKWYCGSALFSEKALACASGIIPA